MRRCFVGVNIGAPAGDDIRRGGSSPRYPAVMPKDNKLDQLSQELGTNQKSSTYAGLGSQSGVTVGLDAPLAGFALQDLRHLL